MDIKVLPKEIAVELLRFIAEHEDFKSTETLGGDVTSGTVKALLREVSDGLSREALAESKSAYDVKGCKVLSKNAKTVISALSSREEKGILTAFGLIEKK